MRKVQVRSVRICGRADAFESCVIVLLLNRSRLMSTVTTGSVSEKAVLSMIMWPNSLKKEEDASNKSLGISAAVHKP